ncbi:hypothetical protein ACN47E_006942 [Coniothyrium glycines]
MADPLSITASVLTLIQVSVQVSVLIKQFRDEVSVIDATLTGLLNDVDGFQRVLESMRETFEQDDIKSSLQATGVSGSHFKNLARSLEDGANTLQQLQTLLDGVNKKTSILDGPRKQLRLKSAFEQIATYREQIQSYRAALQLSLSTIILWNQVNLQKSTEKIPERITPTLDKLYDEFRSFGALLNAKIEKLQNAVANQDDHDDEELKSMHNLRECVRSAADVVSTASTTLNAETSDRISVRYGSDFGDVFLKDANEPMLRWMSSNTVYEYESMEDPTLDPSETSTGDAQTEYQSDSDSDIESELIRSLYNEGKKRKERDDLAGAVRHFRNCLTRFSSNASYASLTSLQSMSACGVSKSDLLEQLTDTYCMQASWSKAKTSMTEKLAITERQVGKKDELYLWDTFKLAEIMMKCKNFTEAHLQARRSLRGFKKLNESGHDGYEKCLQLLIQMCKDEGKVDEEDAYAALLGTFRRNVQKTLNKPSVLEKQLPQTLDHEIEQGAQRPENPTEPVGGNIAQTPSQEKKQPSSPTREGKQDTSSAQSELSKLKEFVVKSDVPENDRSYSGTPNEAEDIDVPLTASAIHLQSLPDKSDEVDTRSGEDVTESEVQTTTFVTPPGSEEEDPIEQTPSDQKSDGEDHTKQKLPIYSAFTKTRGPLVNTIWTDIKAVEAMFTTPEPVVHAQNVLFGRPEVQIPEHRFQGHRRGDFEFLKFFCQAFYAREPTRDCWYDESTRGYTCFIKLNAGRHVTVTGFATYGAAQEAACIQACQEWMSEAHETLLLKTFRRTDPGSDKEVYRDPSSDKEVVETEVDVDVIEELWRSPNLMTAESTSAVPRITVSSDDAIVGTGRITHNIRPLIGPGRSVSDSNLRRKAENALRAQPSIDSRHQRGSASLSSLNSDGTESEWSPGDDGALSTRPERTGGRWGFFGGLTSSRGDDQHHDDVQEGGDDEVPSCPLCNTSLENLTEQAASVHVNRCLDALNTAESPTHSAVTAARSPDDMWNSYMLQTANVSWATFLSRIEGSAVPDQSAGHQQNPRRNIPSLDLPAGVYELPPTSNSKNMSDTKWLPSSKLDWSDFLRNVKASASVKLP